MNIRLFLGGHSPPKLSHRVGGWGNRVSPSPCARAAPSPSRGWVWGNRVSPHPSPEAYVHLSRPCGCAAQRRNEHTVVRGRAAPSHTLPRVGEWGNPVSPSPLLRGPMFTSAVHAAPPRTDGMKIISWEGCALPNPPRGRGLGAWASGPRPLRYGETRFPHAPGAYFHVRSQAVASQWVWPPRAGRGV